MLEDVFKNKVPSFLFWKVLLTHRVQNFTYHLLFCCTSLKIVLYGVDQNYPPYIVEQTLLTRLLRNICLFLLVSCRPRPYL